MSVERSICPDIYHPAIARDGLLTRLRIPGGVLNESQCLTIASLLESLGLEYIQVTNRANLQLRSLAKDLDRELLIKLAGCGLAANNSAVDGIRNIMISPTAGIDAQESIDVRPLADAWHKYLTEHPELGVLSSKFSVGFDGGGSVGIVNRPNDITLLAVGSREFSLYLGMSERGDPPLPVDVRLDSDECVPMLAAIAQSYRRGSEVLGGDTRRTRLRDVIRHYGLIGFGEVVQREFGTSRRFVFKNTDLKRFSTEHGDAHVQAQPVLSERHLGVHQQCQSDCYYLGVVLPLGRWSGLQVRGVGNIAARYGSGQIRLTPWQNLIIPDVKAIDLARVQGLINDLSLVTTANHPSSLLRACAGATGCQFGATDTQRDAIALSEYLAANFTLDRPLNIHFSGCDKSCAQHDRADITLWGDERTSSYRLAIGGITDQSEPDPSDLFAPSAVPIAIGNLIAAYHHQRHPQESFESFTTRQSPVQLHQILHAV